MVDPYPFPRNIWVCLAENFNKSSLSREFTLQRSLQLLTNKGKNLAAYSREFKMLCGALNSIGKPVDESMKIFGYLNGLGREFHPITTVIQSSLTKFPQPTFNDVVSEVQSFDSKLQSSEDNTTTPHLSFNVQQQQPSQEHKYSDPSIIHNKEEDVEVDTTEVVEVTLLEAEALFSISRLLLLLVTDPCVRYVAEWAHSSKML
ncbi:hypothetical protein Bca52824_034654 [Brassica carinata]|uniref:Uncharacterized protein n=1 Tax=Brassica carinata TaxID=52824 RepID=A0A8X7S1Y0_BRACI|nr:hypothetical protein Bca52824_034654 [Brassica carinata]